MPTVSKESTSKKFMNISVGLAALMFIVFCIVVIIFLFMLPQMLKDTTFGSIEIPENLGYLVYNKTPKI